MFLELGDAHETVARLDQFGFDALHLDDGTSQGEHQRLGFVFAQHGQGDLAAGFAAHAFHRIVKCQPLHRSVIEFEDQVAALDADLRRRRVLDGRDHFDQAFFHADLDAQAAEFALGADLQFLKVICIQIGRVRIQAAQHAIDRAGDQLVIADRFHIIGFDAREHFGEGAQIFHGQCRLAVFLGHSREMQAQRHPDYQPQPDQTCSFDTTTHVCPHN